MKHSSNWIITLLLAAALLLSTAMGVSAAGILPAEPASVQPQSIEVGSRETVRVIVQLEGAPAIDRGSGSVHTSAIEIEHQTVLQTLDVKQVDYSLLCEYDTLLNGFSCDVASGDLAKLAATSGVKAVYPVNYYKIPENERQSYAAAVQTAGEISAQQGKGITIAVLDSGVNLNHNAFQVYDALLDQAAVSQEDVAAVIAETGRGQYISKKVPFAYDYADSDNDVSDNNRSCDGHGTHVAGLALGYAETGEGAVEFSGKAPAAQLLAMKVFFDNQDGTDSSIYLLALEDAYRLNADVINMSLGSDYGFVHDETTALENSIFTRLRSSGVILCAAAGNAGSMMTNANSLAPGFTDYGTVNSPATYENSVAVAAGTQWNTMSFFSSWGVTPELTMGPTVAENGYAVRSAQYSSNTGYTYKYGTSMATPNLSGDFALLLSGLRAAGVTDKVQAAELARSLLLSTANCMTGPDGRFYSPRWQGLGFASVDNALSAYQSGVRITEPVKSMGDGSTGIYSFDVVLYNNTNAAVDCTPAAVVMTDKLDADESGSASYRMVSDSQQGSTHMTTDYLYDSYHTYANGAPDSADVTYAVGGSSVSTVTVPANGSVTVTVNITLNDPETQLRYFTNGAFIDGFVWFTPEDGSAAHAAFVGYYGNWTQAPVLEEYDFRDYCEKYYELATTVPAESNPQQETLLELGETPYDYYDVVTDFNTALLYDGENNDAWCLGDNYFASWSDVDPIPYREQHIAISTAATDADNVYANALYLVPYALRNAAELHIIIHEKGNPGNVLADGNYGMTPKTFYEDDWSSYLNLLLSLQDNSGQLDLHSLTNGAALTVKYKAVLPYRDAVQESCWSFDITVDAAAPVLACSYNEEANTLTVTASDNQYLAAVYLVNSKNDLIALETMSDETAAQEHTVTFDLAGLDTGTSLSVRAMDYATNERICAQTVKGPTTIAFAENLELSKTYDGAPLDIDVNAAVAVTGSTGDVTLRYYSDEACTQEIGAPVNAGIYYVMASVEDDGDYRAAETEAPAVLTIRRAASTIAFLPGTELSKDYDGQPFSAAAAELVTVSGSSGEVTLHYYSDADCLSSISAPTEPGTYYVKAAVTEDDNYEAAMTEAALVLEIIRTVNSCGENLTWVLEEGVLPISGTGPMTDYSEAADVPWYENRSSITSVVIESGMTHIGNAAFIGCRKLQMVTIPNGVCSIGSDAFSRCEALPEITIPGSVEEIGVDAFNNCEKLAALTLSEGLQTILNSAFSGCTALTSVTIPNSVTTVGNSVFSDCNKLESIHFGSGLTAISESMFSYCTSLKTLAVPKGITSIGAEAFSGCTALVTVVLPGDLLSIGSNAFATCTRLSAFYRLEPASGPVMNFGSGNTALSGAARSNITTGACEYGSISLHCTGFSGTSPVIGITATPDENHAIRRVYLDGNAVEGDSFVATAADHVVTAEFSPAAHESGADTQVEFNGVESATIHGLIHTAGYQYCVFRYSDPMGASTLDAPEWEDLPMADAVPDCDTTGWTEEQLAAYDGLWKYTIIRDFDIADVEARYGTVPVVEIADNGDYVISGLIPGADYDLAPKSGSFGSVNCTATDQGQIVISHSEEADSNFKKLGLATLESDGNKLVTRLKLRESDAGEGQPGESIEISDGAESAFSIHGVVSAYAPQREGVVALYPYVDDGNGNLVAPENYFSGKTRILLDSPYMTSIGGPSALSSSGRVNLEFTLTDIPAGTYLLVVRKPGHTQYVIRGLVVDTESIDLTENANALLSSMFLHAGDVNENGLVEPNDPEIMFRSANWNKVLGVMTETNSDINGNGLVEPNDPEIMFRSENWNKADTFVDYI